MRQRVWVVGLVGCTGLWLGGCASAGAPTPEMAAGRGTIFTDPNVPTMYADRPVASTNTVPKPPEVVWQAVRLAYADIGVPITLDNPASQQLGNPDFYRSRTFAGRRMPELLSCGNSLTGPNAASFRIFMSLLTTVKADGKGGSTVGVLLSASARDVAGGTSSDRLPCGSSGVLELLMLEKISAHLAP